MFKAKPFTVNVLEERLETLKNGIKFSQLPPPFFEGTKSEFGITSEWMKNAKERWENGYDWRKFESHLNTFSHFLADVPFGNQTYKIHYIHHRSSLQTEPAIPLILLHGWPGAFSEFLDCIKPLTEAGFDVIVPSLPGWCWSEKTALDKHQGILEAAELMDSLMVGLGYKEYAVQGGDIGSSIARMMVTRYDACKAIHLNFVSRLLPPKDHDVKSETAEDQEYLAAAKKFTTYGLAYALEHANRPSTIAHVLFSSPLALLAWHAEKFLDWSDNPPTVDEILDIVTLWVLTDTWPYSVWAYQFEGESIDEPEQFGGQIPANYIHKPFAYSSYPKEIMVFPLSWVKATGNLLWSTKHSKGGHFAAMERPQDFVEDIKIGMKEIWEKRDRTTK